MGTQQADINAHQIRYVAAGITYLDTAHVASMLLEYLTIPSKHRLDCAYRTHLALFTNSSNAATKVLFQHRQDFLYPRPRIFISWDRVRSW